MDELRVDEAAFDSAVGGALVGAQWRELLTRYGVPDDRNDVTADLAADHLGPPGGVFLVGWIGDDAVACGGIRRRDDTTGEVKRMYVAPEHRGRGYSRTVLRALEDRARVLGYTRLVLETGTAQPEAMALYASEGYDRIPGYGYHGEEARVRCYAKDLAN